MLNNFMAVCSKPVQGLGKTFVQTTGLTHSLGRVEFLPVQKQPIYTPITNVMNDFTQSMYTGLSSFFNQLAAGLYPSSTGITTATAVYKLQGGSK